MYAEKSKICGLVLAAGLSTRFGNNKLLHNLSGKPVYSWVLDAVCNSLLTNIVFVCREELLPNLSSYPKIQPVINHDPSAGQALSLRLGVNKLSKFASHILILLADQPLITTSLINSFVTLTQNSQSLACLNTNNYLGPPALFGKRWFKKLEECDGDTGAKKILMKEKNNLQLMPVQFQGQEQDLDHCIDIEILENYAQKHSRLLENID